MSEVLHAPAKINLFLYITGRDDNAGLHLIDSLMVPVTLSDTITVTSADRFSVTMRGVAERLPMEQNLVYRVAKQFSAETGCDIPPVSVMIDKKIPAGAGLGGGSSDGAEFLRYLQRMCAPEMKIERLYSIAHTVGSDIPFFLRGTVCRVTGTGLEIVPMNIDEIPGFFLLVKPVVSISAREAYALYRKNYLTNITDFSINIARKICRRSLKNIVDIIYNDLEAPLLSRYPVLGTIRNDLIRLGAEGVFMTGSGSTMVGLFKDEQSAARAEERLSPKYDFCRTVEITT